MYCAGMKNGVSRMRSKFLESAIWFARPGFALNVNATDANMLEGKCLKKISRKKCGPAGI